MFVDEITVKLIAGKGGDGCTSFHHEKCMPNLGPDGGNGGRGANIIFEVDKSLNTLVDLRYNKIIKGDKGENGKGSNRTGADAKDVLIKVPEGTTIIDNKTKKVLADLVKDKEQFIVCRGGRGGRGNKAFATHDNPTPKMSEKGELGEEKEIKCELKVLADVGLIGLPSVGKSTLLSVISTSKPKIAAYHFTTLNPNLGASAGLGLGLKFLKHAQRTKILAHVIDMGSYEGRNPIDDYKIIRRELINYGRGLENKRQVIIANKKDLPDFAVNLEKFKREFPNLDILEISAEYNDGVEEAMIKIADILDEVKSSNEDNLDYETEIIYKYEETKPFTITKVADGWLVSGDKIKKLFNMTKFSEDESVLHFANKLRKMGVEDELLRLGAKKDDNIIIEGYVFNFKE